MEKCYSKSSKRLSQLYYISVFCRFDGHLFSIPTHSSLTQLNEQMANDTWTALQVMTVLLLFLTTADKHLFYNEAGHLASTTERNICNEVHRGIVKAKQLLRPGKACS